jgi:hypothetical protein
MATAWDDCAAHGTATTRDGYAARGTAAAARRAAAAAAARGAAAAVEKARRHRRPRRGGARVWGTAVMADAKKTTTIVRLKRLRSAFHAMTGRGGRLTRRDGAAFGQSPLSSRHEQTRPVRDDRTLTESDQSLPGNPTRMTGRGGGGRDLTRWS